MAYASVLYGLRFGGTPNSWWGANFMIGSCLLSFTFQNCIVGHGPPKIHTPQDLFCQSCLGCFFIFVSNKKDPKKELPDVLHDTILEETASSLCAWKLGSYGPQCLCFTLTTGRIGPPILLHPQWQHIYVIFDGLLQLVIGAETIFGHFTIIWHTNRQHHAFLTDQPLQFNPPRATSQGRGVYRAPKMDGEASWNFATIIQVHYVFLSGPLVVDEKHAHNWWFSTYLWLLLLSPQCPDKPGAGVSRGKEPISHKPKKKYTSRMCSRPTSALPKPSFLCAPAFNRSIWWWYFGGGWLCLRGVSVVVKWCAVLWCAVMWYPWLPGEVK